MKERALQQDLLFRSSDQIGMVDKRVIKDVVTLILQTNQSSVTYPYVLDGREMGIVKNHLRRNHGDLADRILFIPGIKLTDGAGTLIEIEKGRKK